MTNHFMQTGECRGQHSCCDMCDGLRSDPHTGWGGFRDHFAGRDFSSDEEQVEYYRKAQSRGETGERDDRD